MSFETFMSLSALSLLRMTTMMFILRSIFWLGLVFYFMPWSSRDQAFADLGGRVAVDALSHATGIVGEYCATDPERCKNAPHPIQTAQSQKKPRNASGKASNGEHGGARS
jgi:hypothetical protein